MRKKSFSYFARKYEANGGGAILLSWTDDYANFPILLENVRV